METIRKYFFEWVKTLSGRVPSFFSSKRLERFVFAGVSVMLIIATVIYLMYAGTLTAFDTTVLITPLLVAGGFNMVKSEVAKKNGTDGAD